MDILFSPYGVGTMPKSTMEEIEQKTEDLLRSSSFQQMLELEKKYKMERLQETAIPSLPASPTAAGFSDTHHAPPPQQHQYADSLAQQQKFLMLKAARGHVSLPLLSIKIPHKGKEEEVDAVTPTNAESFHKQVKFLAPEDNEDEDAMSEQSSICHSPSWENYGKKKKEKKLEAERRKKEKAQAEKEAKAAKKRSSSRLSKIQPSSTASINRDPRASTALVHSERSMSDPSFLAQHLTHGQEEYGRSASANNLQQHVGQYPPVVSDLLNNADPRFPLRRSMSEGPVLPHQPASQSHASNPRPPSASRTPMLRHMSPSRHGRSSSANILQTSGSDRSQEYLRPSSGADTGRREGYVRQQRAQSTEQALAGLADDELLEDHSTDSVSRGPARNVWPVRRSSLTQEARLAAMKLVTGRATPPAKDNDSDYFAFSAHPYSSYDADTPAPIAVEKLPGTSQKAQPVQEMASERPHTSQSSSAGSIMSTQSKKSRNLKDAAKAVLSISNGTKSPSTVKLPPYYAIRARLQSRPTTYAESNTSSSGTSVPPPDTALDKLTQNSSSDISKASEVIKQPSSQISEGSSSSSACEDGSPLQSPTTTPDTSRPQSMKDVPFAETELIKSTPNAGDLQDDQRTLRESLDSSNSTTPRLDDSAASQSAKMSSEDKWSRTELPIDPDCDAQSFKTSRSTLDDLGDISMTQPSLAPEPQFTSQLAPEADDVAVQTDPVISIPPRSKRRTQSVSSHIQLSPSTPEDGTSQEPKPRPEKANRKQKRQLRLQEPEELVSSASSTVISSGSTSPTGGIPTLSAEFRIPSNPYVEEYPEVTTSPHHHTIEHSRTFAASSSSVSLPSSRSQSISSKPTAPPRTNSAPVLSSVTPIATSRPTKLAPVSILKQPKNSTEGPSPPLSPGRGAPVLSALPKHMQQLQKDVRQQPPPLPSTTGGSPVAKMFVECCSCKFYHDMPSKIYECMAKPDAVVEDRTLGISGAITTMVKCPWCNHNMSTKCCAGYAAVVYLKEKLH